MKFLIAGFGSIGRRHFRNLLTLGEKDIVLFRTGRSTLPDDEIKDYPVETDLQKALAHRPDVVIIANPTASHLGVAIPAAEAGCTILMEKPISNSLDEVHDLEAALQRGGGQLLVGFQFRFHPGLQRLAELLREGVAGRPLSARVQWGEYLPNWHPWEDYRKSYSAREDLGGGVVLTLSHPLDYLGWLFGEVESLWAFTGKVSDLEIQVEDVGEIGMRFRSGVIGSVHLDYYQRPTEHRMEVACTEGTLLWNNANGAVRRYHPETESWETYPFPAGFDRNDLFLAELHHLIAVAQHEVDPLCTLADGKRALEIALAVHESANTHRMIEL
jgi:predicted dehydrogenase